MKKFITNSACAIFWICIWEIVYQIVDAKFLFASPFDVFKNIIEILKSSESYILFASSIIRIMMGFILAILLGVFLGILSSINKKIIKPLLDILISIIKVVPIVSFIILALVYMPSKIIVTFIVFLMTIPIFYYMTYSIIENVDYKLLEMSEIYDFNVWSKVKYIYINGAKKNIIASFQSALGFAVKSGITAEVLVTPKFSIGEVLYNSKIYLDGLSLISYTVITLILSICIEKIILFVVKKGLFNE